MSPERYRRIQAILQAALERDAKERASFLREACAGNDSLRQHAAASAFQLRKLRKIIKPVAPDFSG